jgi:hypothetical protein
VRVVRGFTVLAAATALAVALEGAACGLHGDLIGDSVTEAGALSVVDFSLCGESVQDPVTANTARVQQIQARTAVLVATQSDAAADLDAGAAATTLLVEAGLGKGEAFDQVGTWSSLYRDYFGPTLRPGSCSFHNYCHGADAKDNASSGYRTAGGIKCDDQHVCWCSFASNDANKNPPPGCPPVQVGMFRPSDSKKPSGANLFGTLRHCNANGDGTFIGIMPKDPAASFTDYALARMKLWIARGAPQD